MAAEATDRANRTPQRGWLAEEAVCGSRAGEEQHRAGGGLGVPYGDGAGYVAGELRAQLLARREEIAIAPDAIARAIAFAIEQPADVDVNDIVVRPTAQA